MVSFFEGAPPSVICVPLNSQCDRLLVGLASMLAQLAIESPRGNLAHDRVQQCNPCSLGRILQ